MNQFSGMLNINQQKLFVDTTTTKLANTQSSSYIMEPTSNSNASPTAIQLHQHQPLRELKI